MIATLSNNFKQEQQQKLHETKELLNGKKQFLDNCIVYRVL